MVHLLRPSKLRDLAPEPRIAERRPSLGRTRQLRQLLHVEVQLVPEQATGGRVGAGLEQRVVQELRQHGQGREHGSAPIAQPGAQRAELANAPHAPVPAGAKSVNGSEDPPSVSAAFGRSQGRRDDETVVAGPPRLHDEPVVPDRQRSTERDLDGPTGLDRTRVHPRIGPLRILLEDAHASSPVRRGTDGDRVEPAVPGNGDRVDRTRGPPETLPERLGRIPHLGERRSESPQDGDDASGSRSHPPAVDVEVARLEPRSPGELHQGRTWVGAAHTPSRSR